MRMKPSLSVEKISVTYVVIAWLATARTVRTGGYSMENVTSNR